MADEDSNQASIKSSAEDLNADSNELVISDSESRSPKRSRLSTDNAATNQEPEGDAEENRNDKINLVIKSTKGQRDVKIDKEETVNELKDGVSKVFNIPLEQVCLIFSGQVLKEDEVLSSSNIQDGNTVHLVIKSKPSNSAPTANSPFGINLFGGMQGFGNMTVGSSKFLEIQQQMQKELQENPELLRKVMTNPFVRTMMENPEYMRQIITSNPQMRDMIDQTPELSHVLSNPETLRTTMEYAKNPDLLEEIMQSKVDNVDNPNGDQGSQEVSKEGATNTDAKESEKPTNKSSGNQGFSGLFQSQSMQNIMQHLMQNPQLVQEMFNAPYMNSMMEAMAANPEVASQVMVDNPIFGNNPAIQEQMRQNLPSFFRQMQNPDVNRFITNPQALSAMLTIHQGLGQLHQAAPDVFNILPGNPFPQAANDKSSSANSRSEMSEVNTDSQETFSMFLHNMVNSISQGVINTEIEPEERYKNQLEMMQTMGLPNKETNLQALIATFGDVNAAVERIFRSSGTLKQ